MFTSYIIMFKMALLALIIALALGAASFILVYRQRDSEKWSSYECGFNPWGDTRGRFEVRFFLVALLFLIFDLEIMFLFPWILAVSNMSIVAFITILIFLFILTIGFIFEWLNRALDWE